MSLEKTLSLFPTLFRQKKVPQSVLREASLRVLDSMGCFYGAFHLKPISILREVATKDVLGPCSLWGTSRRASPEIAAWVSGAAVRALDFNDTYLSQEPCHPSDLLSSLWAACEISSSKNQGRLLLEALVLGYDVVCRLCDAHSLRKRGWDHVNYISIASAVACAYILGLSSEKTRQAVALSIVGNNALRQTRVGTISDWKALCAAYAARSGLNAARLAQAGMTGPSDIFSGTHGFFNQVSGPFSLPLKHLGRPWKILVTHVKYYPAEHHAQSAIEAAVSLSSQCKNREIKKILIESFDASVQIIGSEKEKWAPQTRETADHSLPYLVCAALLEGDITLNQYKHKLYLRPDIRALLKRTSVVSSKRYTQMYPAYLPACVTLIFSSGEKVQNEVLRPKGYAGRPMTKEEMIQKFSRLTHSEMSPETQKNIQEKVLNLVKIRRLAEIKFPSPVKKRLS